MLIESFNSTTSTINHFSEVHSLVRFRTLQFFASSPSERPREALAESCCFQLYCGTEYTYSPEINPTKNYDQFLNNSVFVNIPFNGNDEVQYVNESLYLVNNQVVALLQAFVLVVLEAFTSMFLLYLIQLQAQAPISALSILPPFRPSVLVCLLRWRF